MKLLWLYLSAFLMLPIIGEFVVWYNNIEISAGMVSPELIIHNIIFVLILLTTALLLSNYKIHDKPIVELFDYNYAQRIFTHSIILLIVLSTTIFALGGYRILFHLANRGEVRTMLGIFGPIYTVALSYLPIAIIVFSSVVYIHLSEVHKKYFRKKLIIIYLFAIVLGIFSGYKAAAVMLMIPGFVVLFFNKMSILKLLLFGIVIILLLTLFTVLVRNMELIDSFNFLIHRMTVMTAYGTIGVWNEFPDSASLSDIFVNFIGAFGEKISSTLTGISPHDPQFLKTNLSRLVTYRVYPDTEGALAGSVNVTVTNFGHALYILGKPFYVYYAFIMGIVIGLIIRLLKKYIMEGYPLKASMVALYLFAVILPSINSGGIFMLISLPVLIYFVMVYFSLRYLIQGRIIFV